MAIISITILESSEQISSGIPRSVEIFTNIPATIFYTLDGSDPDLSSDIYTEPLFLPTNLLKIELKVLATNGIMTSSVVSEEYQTNILMNARLPHSSTDAQAGENLQNLYPFGTNPLQPTTEFLNPGDSGITVDNPDLTQIPTGFDGYGNEIGFTNEPYNLENYSIIYSVTDAQGRPSIGTLPASVTIEIPSEPPEETQQFSNLFDPKAFVIFQNFNDANNNDPAQINRQFFSLEDPEKSRDGALFFNTGLDSPPMSGSYLKSYYNPRDNTITYYYFDSKVNKWIISKTDYVNTGGYDGKLYEMAISKNKGAGMVFEWIYNARRVLF